MREDYVSPSAEYSVPPAARKSGKHRDALVSTLVFTHRRRKLAERTWKLQKKNRIPRSIRFFFQTISFSKL